MPENETTQILVAIASLDGKVTGALGAIENLKGTDTDHEARLRKIEESLTSQRYITPGQLWAGLIGLAGVGAAVATIVATVLPR